MKVMNNLSTRLLFTTVVMLVMAAMATTALGQTTYTSTVTGNWSTMTWSPPGTPGSSDNVIIADADTVTINTGFNVNSITIGSGVGGLLKFDGAAIRKDTVGDITINSGGQFIGRLNNQAGF